MGHLRTAYAESGDFEQAIKFEKQALRTEGIDANGIEGENRRLKLFEQHKPTHEMPN